MERNKVNKVGVSGKLSCTKVNQVRIKLNYFYKDE
jgi:hypothetical protein